MPEINQDLFEQLQNLTSNFQGLNRELNPLLDIEKEHNKNLKKTQDQLKDFGKQAVTTGKALYDATMSINEGTAKYGAAVKGAAGMVGDLAGQFGIFGKVIGTVIKAFGGLAASSLEQNERLVKFTQRVSEFGAIDFSGVEGLSESLKNAGLTSDLLEVFEKSLKNFGGTLGALGGTAAKGAKRFSDVMGNIVGGEFERDLRKLGYTTDGIYDVASKYIDRETKYGNVSRKNNEQITESLKRYYNELEAVTRITGMNRQEQEEIRRQNREQIRFNDYLEGLNKDQRNAVENFTTILSDADPQFRQGMIDLIVNGGAMVSDEAIKVFQATRGQFLPIFKQVEAGAMDPVEGLKLLSKQINIQYQQTKNIVAQNEQGIKVMGVSNKLEAFARRTKQFETIEDAKRYLKESKEADGRLDEEARRVQEERKNQRLRNEILEMTGNTLVKVMTSVSEVMTFFGKTVAKTIDFMSKYIPGMDKTNLEALFVTNVEEAKELLETNKKQLEKLEERKTKQEERLAKITEKVKKEPKDENAKNVEKFFKSELESTTKSLEQQKKVVQQLEKVVENTGKKEEKPALNTGAGRGVQGGPTAKELEGAKTKEKKEPVSDAGSIIDKVLSFGGKSGSKNNFEALDATFKEKVVNAAKEYYEQTGKKLQINSAYRDGKDQQRLWDESVKAGRTGFTKEGNPIAKPGTSKHERGLAIDIQNYNDKAAIDALAKQGIFQTMGDKDPVHFSIPKAQKGGVFAGPGSGYPVMMHGNEMVIPLKEESVTGKVTQTELPKPTVATAPIRENNFEMALAPLIERVDSLISEIIAQKRVQEDLLHITRATV